jgi:hypothetical protein
MVHRIENGPDVNITFNNGTARVSLGSQGDFESLLVKWFCDGNPIGEMDLPKLTWGSYNNHGISNWMIEFWNNGELISTFNNNLRDKQVLILAKFENSTPGKNYELSSLIEYANGLNRDYLCSVYVYFEGSERFDFSKESFLPLGINSEVSEFAMIIEKTFNG